MSHRMMVLTLPPIVMQVGWRLGWRRLETREEHLESVYSVTLRTPAQMWQASASSRRSMSTRIASQATWTDRRDR